MSAPSAPIQTPAPTGDPISAKVLEIVAGQTGYPLDMLEPDLDLEADLGVDTVKQAETFAAIREAFDIPRDDSIKLRDYPTLAHVIGFVKAKRPDLAVSAPVVMVSAPAVSAPSAPVQAPALTGDPISAKVLEIVAGQTGYPLDMLEPDLDLEADLGVDTVKQAETFAAIREAFAIPRDDSIKLRDYPTLAHVIGFVRSKRPDLAGAVAATASAPTTPVATASVPAKVTAGDLAVADSVPRRVPTPALRPDLAFCKPTGVALENARILIMPDQGGVAVALAEQLNAAGAAVMVAEPTVNAEELTAQIAAVLAEGPITGLYWLPALDAEPELETLDLAAWRELNRVRVKNLHAAMRALYETVVGPETFLVTGSRLGGLHGYGPDGATSPMGGAVVGFAKAYKREREQATIKAVDFTLDDAPAFIAERLIGETLGDPGIVEIGWYEGARFTVTLFEQPAVDGGQGLALNYDTVFLVTGAAGGITSAIVADLAAASGGIFYLMDLAPLPNRNDEKIRLFRTDKDALKRTLIDEARAKGEKPTPAQIEKIVFGLEREESALRAVEAVEAAGGTAFYHAVNLLDGVAVAGVIHEIRAKYGRIDVLVHAGGLEISRTLPDKDAKQFDLVFDVKADGFFSILRAAAGMPIGATVAFSSVAGRFGNSGQTDYSAANDLLCKITSSFRRTRPDTKGLVIDWTAWGGIGMATRGSIPKIMEMAGIDMLPPEAGIPTVRRELVAGGFRGEIVVAGRLGILGKEWDAASGGANAEALTAEARARGLAMIGTVKAVKLYGGIEIETPLDPSAQPFLYDHAMEGTPLLPGVMATETFAEAAALMAPGWHVAAVEHIQFSAPFKFYRMEPATLYVSVTVIPADGALIARCALRSMRPPTKPGLPAQEKLHFTADVRLTREAPEPLFAEVNLPAPASLDIAPDRIYKVYFHGPAYQVLASAAVAGDEAIGLWAEGLPADTAEGEPAWLVSPRLIELCFQTAGIWEIRTKNTLALPMAFQSVTAYRTPEPGKPLFALVEAVDGGTAFNAVVVDADGAIYARLVGYQTVALPDRVTL